MEAFLDIESILPERSIVKTRHPGSYDWVTTIVQKTYGNQLEVEQVEDYMVKVVMIGDSLLCKYTDKDYLYTLETTVDNVKFTTQSVVLAVNNVKKIKNIRCSLRYDAYLSSSMKPQASFNELYSVVTNLSHSGMSVITKGIIEIGEKINLNIYLSGTNVINCLCEVKWSDIIWPNNMYGIQIVEMNDNNRLKYEEYIKKLECKEKRLISKYNENKSM